METKTEEIEREASESPKIIGEKILGFDVNNNPHYLDQDFVDLFDKSKRPWQISVAQASQMTAAEIKNLIVKEGEDMTKNFDRIRTWEYILFYCYIKSSNRDSVWDSLSEKDKFTLTDTQNEVMNGLHKKINEAIRIYLKGRKSETADSMLATMDENEKHEQTTLGNIKIFRGLYCNANCIFCFQENSSDPKVDNFVQNNRPLKYTPEQLFRALLYARAAYKLREVSFTGGEALVNKPKLFAQEVELAREAGYPQISTMSNGRLMDKEMLRKLVESGLTHVILSIHTVDPLKHFQILNWKDAKRPIVKSVMEEEGLTDIERKELVEGIASEFLKINGGVGITDRLSEAASRVREKVGKHINQIYGTIIQNIKDASELHKKFGTKVRLNFAYNPNNIGTDLSGILKFASDLGVHEVTLIEMIPGNETAISMHIPLPGDAEFLNLGYEPLNQRNWQVGGIRIYKKEGSPTFATCNFGQLNQLTLNGEDTRQFADFSGQEKEVLLHPNGTLSASTYEKRPILYWASQVT